MKDQPENYMRVTLIALAGPLVWVLYFATVYLLEGFLCRVGAGPASLVVPVILVATLICVGFCGWLFFAADRWLRKAGEANTRERDFLVFITRMLAGLGVMAILWTVSGTIFLRPCTAGY